MAANPPILRREAIAGEKTFCTLSVPRLSSGDGIAARRARHASSDRQAGAGGIVSWTLYAWNDRVRRLDLSALAGNFTNTTLIGLPLRCDCGSRSCRVIVSGQALR